MTEWQPIETAPKDGTFILIFADPDTAPPVIKGNVCGMMTATWRGGYWRVSLSETGNANECGYLPTHWMPLPEPPRS